MNAIARRLLLPCTILAAVSLCGCPTIARDVTLTPFAEGLGFTISGPYGLEGTLTKDEASGGNWVLDAWFAFPSAGYEVGEVEVVVGESYPEQVWITIPVSAPGPGCGCAAVITVVPVQTTIQVSDGASFSIEVRETVRPM